jgi:hypothetical protein
LTRAWPTGACPLAALFMSYTPAKGGAPVAQSLPADYAGSDPLADDTIYYSQRAVRKSVALVNEALAEAQSSSLYYGSGGQDSAIALIERTRSMLVTEAGALEDADLQTEAANLAQLETNMRNGGYASSYPYDEQPMACAFTPGQPGQAAALATVLGLLVLAGLGRRRR